ncbi:reverse transcriptase domain-containing protein [Tanacetum coccineum]
MTLRTRVRSLEQHDVVTRESLRIAKGKFTLSQLQAEYAEQEVRELREFWVTNRFEMDELQSRAQDIEASFWDLGRHLRMSFAEIEQIVAQRVANAIETIVIYEAKTRVARDLINWVKQHMTRYQGMLATRGSGKVTTVEALANNKTKSIRTPVPRAKQMPLVEKQKAKVTCYECGRLRHYKSGCPERKNQKHVNKQWKGKSCGYSSVMANNVNV